MRGRREARTVPAPRRVSFLLVLVIGVNDVPLLGRVFRCVVELVHICCSRPYPRDCRGISIWKRCRKARVVQVLLHIVQVDQLVVFQLDGTVDAVLEKQLVVNLQTTATTQKRIK